MNDRGPFSHTWEARPVIFGQVDALTGIVVPSVEVLHQPDRGSEVVGNVYHQHMSCIGPGVMMLALNVCAEGTAEYVDFSP